jgi:ABC-2 type transport system ATP-binding protein
MTTTPALELCSLSKRYRKRGNVVAALDDVSTTLQEGRIYGLLGRNGAGKSTLMSLATAQAFPTSGEALVFGHTAYEHRPTLATLCFVKESQKYPDDFEVRHALHCASLAFRHWDADFAARLVTELRLPTDRRIKKLSRGQLSAVGIVIGLASRAELTFFDEPYLGLDAVARQVFYDRLLEDFAEHPRTIVLSSHLIDEVADVLEHVLLLEDGRLVLDAPADEVRGGVTTLHGPTRAVLDAAGSHEVLARKDLGPVTQLTVKARYSGAELAAAEAQGIGVEPATLQQTIVFLTRAGERADA